MRKPVLLEDFVGAVEARKRAIGFDKAALDEVRNDGERRTPEKRALLRRMEQRARAAGLQPYPARIG